MTKTSKTLAAIALISVAAFGVSACKWPGAKDKDPAPAPASSATAENIPTAPDASSAAPAVSAAAPASSAVADSSAKTGK